LGSFDYKTAEQDTEEGGEIGVAFTDGAETKRVIEGELDADGNGFAVAAFDEAGTSPFAAVNTGAAFKLFGLGGHGFRWLIRQ
jgi:hypothetical protein